MAAFRIRWAKILLACPGNGDWDHCKYKLEASNRSCRNHIGKKRLRTWSRLIQSFLHDDHKTVERFWEDVPPFLLCRRHHYEQSEKIHALWLKGLETFHVHVADDVFVEDQYQPPTPISLLPSQILFSILANLDEGADWYRCMLVSRKWAETAVRLLWKQIECSDPRDYDAICQALSCGSPFFTYQDFIRKLTLTALSTKLDDKSILPLAGCTRLEFLSLSPCPNLTDAGMMPLVGKNPQLEYLYICHSGHITRQSMNAVANTCKALKGLALIGCNNISNESMIGLFGKCSFITMVRYLGAARKITVMSSANTFNLHLASLRSMNVHKSGKTLSMLFFAVAQSSTGCNSMNVSKLPTNQLIVSSPMELGCKTYSFHTASVSLTKHSWSCLAV